MKFFEEGNELLPDNGIVNDTYAEINLSILKNNFRKIKSFVNKKQENNVKICSVVKANAYGHGMNETSRFLSKAGSDYLATADYYESIILRKYLRKFSNKETPILCLGILSEKKKFFDEIVKYNIEVTISDLKIAMEFNDFLSSKNKKHKVQIQVDTGMNRVGIPIDDAYENVIKISRLPHLIVNGIYSHFATSEIFKHGFALKQQKKFIDFVHELETAGLKFKLKHMENTGGFLNYRNDFFNMVRPGISLYGYYPGKSNKMKNIGIEPVMSLKSKVSMIKTVQKSNSISYGRKYFTSKDTKIASIPAGYGDGYPRLLTNKSKVIINSKPYKTVGAICMDWIMAELGKNSGVKVNDEVILFGKEYPADKIAEITGTIPYEILCNVSPRVQRVYVN
jgi:alanine racemase